MAATGASHPARRDQEHAELNKRAAALAKELEAADERRAKALQKSWDQLVQEIEAWAERFRITPVEMTLKAGAEQGPPGGGTVRRFSVCKSTIQADGMTCYLKRETRSHDCIYKCFPSPPRP